MYTLTKILKISREHKLEITPEDIEYLKTEGVDVKEPTLYNNVVTSNQEFAEPTLYNNAVTSNQKFDEPATVKPQEPEKLEIATSLELQDEPIEGAPTSPITFMEAMEIAEMLARDPTQEQPNEPILSYNIVTSNQGFAGPILKYEEYAQFAESMEHSPNQSYHGLV